MPGPRKGRRSRRLHRSVASILIALALAAGLAQPAFAVAGDLDTTFGGDGRVTTFVPPGGVAEANAVAVQGDGKIVAVGTDNLFEGEQTRFAVIRYNSNGTLDTAFGGDGIVTTNFTPHDDHAFGVAIQADEKIVVVGYSGQGGANDVKKLKLTLARYNSNGTLDSTFGGDGKVRTNVGRCWDFGRALAIQADGKIVAGGISFSGANCDNATFALIRYNSDGTLDSTFGGDGKVTTDLTSRLDFAFADAIQADGKIVAAGVSGLGGPNPKFALARYNSNGTLDSAFGGDGKVTTDFTRFVDWGDSVAIQADGKIVASGTSGLGGPNSKFGLVRYNSNGTLDSAFGGDGKVTTDFTHSGDEDRSAVAIQADGQIVVAGSAGFEGGGGNWKFGVARYNSNGTLDSAFGGDGKVTTDFTRLDDSGAAVAISPDGSIVVAGVSGIGSSDVKVAVARYLSG
jgi:uncharacterized delta-60 repeat protein